MIALTQEKREELANYARARLASHVVHGGCSDEEDIFKIALASLTAESIAHADSKAILKMIKGHTRFFTSFPERSETKRVGLFIAPPVPEINPSSELTALLNAIDSFQFVKDSDKWNESGKWDDVYEKLSEAAIKAAPLIKHLNGLGY